ncbi:M23 family metallopeptidase [bacterium]|nr:M23 family metallopeptidase [candidate division CSSED10-310 bacterium]
MADRGLAIRYLTSNKKIIPIQFKSGGFWHTNVKLPDIVLSNLTAKPVELKSVSLTGFSNEYPVINIKILEDELHHFISRINSRLNTLISDRNSWETLKIAFGKMFIPENGYNESLALPGSRSLNIPLSMLVFLHYIGRHPLSSARLTIIVDSANGTRELSFEIAFTPFITANTYNFPLKGSFCIANQPMSITSHRSVLSQEFAIDIVAIRQLENGQLATSTRNPSGLQDYFIYSSDVYSIGDGKIVECGTAFPESEMNIPSNYSEETFLELTKRLIPEIGFLNTFCGNYIVIEHDYGEFSFYAHLKSNGIRVSEGQTVKKGEIIAQVGNTGHSTEPHLHFQLMDGKNFLEANGLPVVFENIPVKTMNHNFDETNSFIFSDFLYFNVT